MNSECVKVRIKDCENFYTVAELFNAFKAQNQNSAEAEICTHCGHHQIIDNTLTCDYIMKEFNNKE